MQHRPFHLIAALDLGRSIGHADGSLPWKLKTDLERFKRLTMGGLLVMGRRTAETLKKPLPGRTSVVLTRSATWSRPGFLVAHSVPEALRIADLKGLQPWAIGGTDVFEEAIPLSGEMHLTLVWTRSNAPVLFPQFNVGPWWCAERETGVASEADQFSSRYFKLVRGVPTRDANPWAELKVLVHESMVPTT